MAATATATDRRGGSEDLNFERRCLWRDARVAVSILGRDGEAQVDAKSPLAGGDLGPITEFYGVQC